MLSNPKLASAVRLALVSSAATAALYAPATFAADEEAMEVVVTGTRIAKPDLESNSPITTVTAETLEQLNTVNLEGTLRQMPQFLPGSTEYINNGNPGAATINLRGLGSNRTLVLMDGKRLPPFGLSGAVDINLIPAALIERVDVVTGGASAVYGSDAVSGVVNFITKKNFEGVQLEANTSQYGKGDGQIVSASLTAGGKFADDRGSAVISFGYTKRDPVLQGARAYSNYFLNPVDGYRYNGNWYQYSSDIFDAGRRGGSSNAGATRASVWTSGTGRGTRYFTPDGQFLSSTATGNTQYGPNRIYNYNPYNYFQVPQERWTAFASMDYKLNDSAEVYGRVFAVDSSVPTQLAPSAYFGGSTADFKVNVDNPFLSAAQKAALITVYNNEAAAGLHGVYDAAAAAGSQQVTVAGIRRRLPELGNRVGVSDQDLPAVRWCPWRHRRVGLELRRVGPVGPCVAPRWPAERRQHGSRARSPAGRGRPERPGLPRGRRQLRPGEPLHGQRFRRCFDGRADDGPDLQGRSRLHPRQLLLVAGHRGAQRVGQRVG